VTVTLEQLTAELELLEILYEKIPKDQVDEQKKMRWAISVLSKQIWDLTE